MAPRVVPPSSAEQEALRLGREPTTTRGGAFPSLAAEEEVEESGSSPWKNGWDRSNAAAATTTAITDDRSSSRQRNHQAAEGSSSARAANDERGGSLVPTASAALSPDSYAGPSTLLLSGPNAMTGLYGGIGGGMYGGASGGYSPFAMMSPLMMGAGGGFYGAAGVGGPLSSLNQFLFGVQTVIFSLGQAVQIVGMNAHALQHLLDVAIATFDRAIATYHDMRLLEASREVELSDDDLRRRRRLQALRWTAVVAATYGGYRLVRRLLSQRHRRHQYPNYQHQLEAPPHYYPPGTSTGPYNCYSQYGLPPSSNHPTGAGTYGSNY